MVGGFGLALAIACAYPLARNLLVSVPVSQVASCRVTFSHTYFVYLTLNSGRTVVLDELDVAEPARCLPPGTIIEKTRGDFAYRINGQQFFWKAKETHSYVSFMAAGLIAAVLAFGSVLRTRDAP